MKGRGGLKGRSGGGGAEGFVGRADGSGGRRAIRSCACEQAQHEAPRQQVPPAANHREHTLGRQQQCGPETTTLFHVALQHPVRPCLVRTAHSASVCHSASCAGTPASWHTCGATGRQFHQRRRLRGRISSGFPQARAPSVVGRALAPKIDRISEGADRDAASSQLRLLAARLHISIEWDLLHVAGCSPLWAGGRLHCTI